MSIDEWRSQVRGRAQVRGAKATIEDGMRFASKLEARRYLYWSNLWHIGAIEWFTRQVPFYLPGNIIWRADFLVVIRNSNATGLQVIVEDCKGHMTRVSLNKIKQVEAIYGFKVQIIKKGDFK